MRSGLQRREKHLPFHFIRDHEHAPGALRKHTVAYRGDGVVAEEAHLPPVAVQEQVPRPRSASVWKPQI